MSGKMQPGRVSVASRDSKEKGPLPRQLTKRELNNPKEFSDFFGLKLRARTADNFDWLGDPKNLLYLELAICEAEARRGGKRKTYDTHLFEAELYENLTRLRDTLWERAYKPSRGTAHIVFRPVQREIFAAPFRDRVVHHWVIDQTMPYWDKRFIEDSYSCREKKGTLYGIKRLDHHIRSASLNYARPVWIMKLDITGYFMHIDRQILLKRVLEGLEKQFADEIKGRRFLTLCQVIEAIIMDDPTEGVTINGSLKDWRGLPEDKSLFAQPKGKGLVIGNLTSQFYSNIYLDALDRFIQFDLSYKHYGRYVDDFFIVVTDEELPQLKRDVKVIEHFLAGLGLSLNRKKTKLFRPWQGVPFLGAIVKDGRILPGKRLATNFRQAAYEVATGRRDIDSMPSYLGLLSQFKSEKTLEKVFSDFGWRK